LALQTQNTSFSPQDAYNFIRANAQNIKALAQNALAVMQGGPVTTPFVFSMVDQLANIVSSLTTLKAIAGLDAYATAQGYSGSLASDCTACAAAAQTCITWVTTNFPIGTAYTAWNADGSRVPHSFTTAQTAGLQTNLQAFIATIG
jgi:hypothetical protein